MDSLACSIAEIADDARPLWSLTITEASALIASRKLSPVDLVEAFLARIADVDGHLRSFIHLDAAGARQAAQREAEELRMGRWRGPLHGIPFGVKDNYDAVGLRASANSRARLDRIAETDASIVARLKSAGAILLGKLNSWEYGTGNGGEYADTPFPTARNPWDIARFAGGSSTGAGAAVAAGTVMFALGSDTTGSVRLPAAACGVLGLKPTPGRVSRAGILPNCYSLDIPGSFTWTAADCALVLSAIAGVDSNDPTTEAVSVPNYARDLGKSVAGMRVAVVGQVGPGLPEPDAPMRAAFAAAVAVLKRLGCILVETELPVPVADCYAVSRFIGPPESAAIHEAEYRDAPDQLGFALRDKLHAGSMVRAVDYIAAQRRRRAIADVMDGFLRGYDALVTFGAHHVAPRLGVEPEMTNFTAQSSMTPFNLSSHPALVQCTGFESGGLPLHWQIVGNRFDEASMLRLAAAYEAATDWRTTRAKSAPNRRMNKAAMDMTSETRPLHFLSITEASRLIQTRALSPVDLVEAFLARIEAVDGRIHSYITVLAARARKAAKDAAAEIAAGRWKGPLHGIPFAVKDNYHVTGVPTTGGSRLMADTIADDTSTIVGRLEQAGAILLGKLNTWEYGTGNGQVYHDLPYEVARNPWDLARFTGGSSTGAGAAVAAGTAMFALGSDTGGSIRLPAAACGLQGFKATFGRVSRAGCIPNCWSLDHTGPLCWSVEDTAIVLQAIAGHDSRDPSSAKMEVPDYRQSLHQGVKGLVIGVVRDLGPDGTALDAANADAIDLAAKVLEGLGAIIRDVRLPAPLPHYRDASKIINWSESLSIHEQDFMERSHLMGQALREKMMSGFMVRAVDYIAALRLRRSLAKATDALVRSCDALLLANAFHIAPRFDEPDTVPLFTSDTACSVFNMTGHPALSICTGFDPGGVPLNAQLVGRYFDEATVLKVAQAFESATPWRHRRPNL